MPFFCFFFQGSTSFQNSVCPAAKERCNLALSCVPWIHLEACNVSKWIIDEVIAGTPPEKRRAGPIRSSFARSLDVPGHNSRAIPRHPTEFFTFFVLGISYYVRKSSFFLKNFGMLTMPKKCISNLGVISWTRRLWSHWEAPPPTPPSGWAGLEEEIHGRA